MPPELLELEITESSLISNPEDARQQMKKLRNLGIHLSIDDFGTGYSSLSYLHELPVNTVKIDQSFVRNLQATTGALPLIQAIISASHALGLSVIAEGVETDTQKHILVRMGCDTLQGYLLARPLPVERVEELLASVSCAHDIEAIEAVTHRAGFPGPVALAFE